MTNIEQFRSQLKAVNETTQQFQAELSEKNNKISEIKDKPAQIQMEINKIQDSLVKGRRPIKMGGLLPERIQELEQELSKKLDLMKTLNDSISHLQKGYQDIKIYLDIELKKRKHIMDAFAKEVNESQLDQIIELAGDPIRQFVNSMTAQQTDSGWARDARLRYETKIYSMIGKALCDKTFGEGKLPQIHESKQKITEVLTA